MFSSLILSGRLPFIIVRHVTILFKLLIVSCFFLPFFSGSIEFRHPKRNFDRKTSSTFEGVISGSLLINFLRTVRFIDEY